MKKNLDNKLTLTIEKVRIIGKNITLTFKEKKHFTDEPHLTVPGYEVWYAVAMSNLEEDITNTGFKGRKVTAVMGNNKLRIETIQ